MTICIAMHFDDYVLLATDCRRSFDQNSVIYRDAAKNIVQTEIGTAVGCGMVQLHEAVEERITRKGAVYHSDDFLTILMSERRESPHGATVIVSAKGQGDVLRPLVGGKTGSSPPVRGGHRPSPPSSPLDERRRAAHAALIARRPLHSSSEQWPKD